MYASKRLQGFVNVPRKYVATNASHLLSRALGSPRAIFTPPQVSSSLPQNVSSELEVEFQPRRQYTTSPA